MTTNDTHDLSRRRVLGGIGALGIGFLGSRGIGFQNHVTTPPAQRYTHYTYAAPSGEDLPRLKVAWYSTYNGTQTETTAGDEPTVEVETPVSGSSGGERSGAGEGNGTDDDYQDVAGSSPLQTYVDEVDGPLFAESNVLPGDFGTASIGLFVEGDESVRIHLRPTVDGALAEVIDVTLGYDTGFLGIGGCGGAETPADVAEDVTMSLAAFGETYGSGTGLLLDPGCLDPGDGLCLGFAWELPDDVANEWQGTSVAFELAFVAEGCVR